MDSQWDNPRTVEEYIAQYPEYIQEILHKIRAVILEEAPEAVEKISYDMPGYWLDSSLIWFAAWKKHIAVYPVTSGMIETLGDALAPYEKTKGSIHFSLDKPIPYELIRRIVNARISEVMNERREYGK